MFVGVSCNFIKIGLRGMLVCYFVKIDMYLAAEKIIIYQDFFSKKSAFFYDNLNLIVRASSTLFNQMHLL